VGKVWRELFQESEGAMSEPTLHSESLASVAIDGARIGIFTAAALVEMDPEIWDEKKAELLIALADAAAALNFARERFPVITTSVHIVQA
jgi:hypothetical protein